MTTRELFNNYQIHDELSRGYYRPEIIERVAERIEIWTATKGQTELTVVLTSDDAYLIERG